MCGEIEKWQKAEQVCVRVTSGSPTKIVLNKAYENVQEIRLDEVMITGFNGGVSAACYVQLEAQGLSNSGCNNENRRGLLVPIDVLNPGTFYSRPRQVATSEGITVNQFELSILLASTGAAATLTEGTFVFTFVMHKPATEIAAYRQKVAMMDAPSIRDPVRNSYNPSGPK